MRGAHASGKGAESSGGKIKEPRKGLENFGQAGLDFLMTYGWALVIIVLVIGILFAFGVFDIGSFVGYSSSGFEQVGVKAWQLAPNGAFTAVFTNRAGVQINVTGISYAFGANGAPIQSNASWFILPAAGSTGSILVANNISSYSPGDFYSAKIDIRYVDLKTGFPYRDSGSLTGKVVAASQAVQANGSKRGAVSPFQ